MCVVFREEKQLLKKPFLVDTGSDLRFLLIGCTLNAKTYAKLYITLVHYLHARGFLDTGLQADDEYLY